MAEIVQATLFAPEWVKVTQQGMRLGSSALAGAGYTIDMRYQRAEPPLKLDGLDAARRFFATCFANMDPSRESLWVAHIDREARCLHVSYHDGGAASAQFPIRTIIADAALHGSAGVVLAHNHPSGDASPSDSDRRATRRLAEAAQSIDLTVVDHVIFAGAECRSFRRMGLL